MVSSLSIVFMIVTVLISIGLPIALIIWVSKKYKPGFMPIGMGMIVFFVMQIVIRTPLIQLLSMTEGVQQFIQNNMVLYIVILSFTAGIFEEGGRYIAFKWLLKKKREWQHGIAYGIGHGGIEAFLLVGLAYIANIIFSIVINQGALESAALTPGILAQVQQAAAPLVETPSYMFLISGLERVFAIALHIALSVFVLYGINARKKWYLLFAMLIHGLVNLIAVTLGQNVSIWLSEVFMLLVAIGSIVYIVKMRRVFTSLHEPTP